MSDSGSVASPSAKAGFRSKAKDKTKSFFKSPWKRSIAEASAGGGECRSDAILLQEKGTPPREAQNTTRHISSSPSAIVGKSLPIPQNTSNPDTASIADLSSVPGPSSAAENQSTIPPSSNSPSAIAESTPPPIPTTSYSVSTAVPNLPLVSSPSTAPSPPQAAENLCPIHELWNQAYDELKMDEEKLMADYEGLIGRDISTIAGLTVSLSGLKVQRQEQLANLLQNKVEEVKRNAWKLKFGGKDIPVKDLAQPAVAVINWANDYISTALASNPYASIAWSGVSLLLPLAVNPSKQAASLAKGLSTISDLIVRSKMREDLYERRYESKAGDDGDTQALASHIKYWGSLKQLYVQILKFQATSVCYFSKTQALRLGLDAVKWNDWDSALVDIQEREKAFGQVYDIWRDFRCQEESEVLHARHEENMKNMAVLCRNALGLRKAIEDRQGDKERAKLLDWLSDVDPSVNFNAAIRKREQHTGNWLLKDNEMFENWQTAPNSLLWLNGKAGSGKSVLCASAAKHLQKIYDPNAEAALVQFYFSFSDAKKQNLISILSSIIKQLCCRRPDTPVSVESLLQYKLKGERPDIKVLEETLLATMHGFTYVYMFLDALDECPYDRGERNELLSSLYRIRKSAPDSLRLFLTSRRERDIEVKLQTFSSTAGISPIIDLNLLSVQAAVERDIGLYIDQTFRETDPFYTWNSSIQAEAKAKLITKADGMFQYVSCQFDSLRDHHSAARIRTALEDLPSGLDETYERILNAIKPGYRKQVASTLKWLTYSMRPLLLEELAEIFILDVDNSVPFDEDDRLDPVDAVLNYLPGLIIKVPVYIGDYSRTRYTESATEIRFAHFSIQEYLSSERALTNQTFFSTRNHDLSHLHIANSCFAFHLQLSGSTLATIEMCIQYHLWEYAAQEGMKHLEKVPYESWTPAVINRTTYIFTTQSQALLNAIRISEQDYNLPYEQLCPPLYYAAEMGFFRLASQLIQNGADANAEGGYYGSALQAAALGGLRDIVQLLLKHSANVNAEGGEYGSALQAAAFRGRLDIVQLLLKHGANVNAEGGEYGSALQAAVFGEYLDIMQLLLKHNANVNAEGGYFGSALQAVAYKGHLDVVQLLLKHNANVNAEGGEYGSALQAAAFRGHLDSVQLLLKHDANVNTEGGYFGSALQAAAFGGYPDIVQLLLEHNANVNAEGGYYGSALQAAAHEGYLGIAQRLLEPDRVANINAKGGMFGNALQGAIAEDSLASLEIASLLCSRGAEVDLPGREWQEMLARVGKSYFGPETVERLRKFQGDPNGYVERRRRELNEELAP